MSYSNQRVPEYFLPKIIAADTIAAMSQAKIVVGECGSGMHNAIFCPPGARIGVIQSEHNENFLPAQLAMWREHEVWYLIGKGLEGGVDGAFTIDLREAKRFAQEILAAV